MAKDKKKEITAEDLLKKYGQGFDKAVQQHANDETTYGSMRMPGGVKNGIARLTVCELGAVGAGKRNEGQYYLRMAGVAIEPDSVMQGGREFPVRNVETSIIVMLCETKNDRNEVTTQAEQVKTALNHLRMVGVDTAGATASKLPLLCKAAMKAGPDGKAPYFRFETRLGTPSEKYPEPKVFETWLGNKGLEDYQEPEVQDVEEETEETEETETEEVEEVEEVKPAPKPAAKPAKTPPAKAEKPPAKPAAKAKEETKPAFSEFGDLDSLAEQADQGDKKAQKKLKQFALAMGFTEDEVVNSDTWADLVKAMQERADAGGDDEGELEPAEEKEEEEEEQEAGDSDTDWIVEGGTCMYAPVGSSGNKLKPVECEITSISGENVALKNLTNGRVYGRVKKSELSQVE